MKVVAKAGRDDIATVYVGETDGGKQIEFVESIQPPTPRDKKWVLIISTLYGCPSQCRFCDAGASYQGKLSASDIFEQIDYMVVQRYPSRVIPAQKFKIQFSRMGEPAFNLAVLDVLEQLPTQYDAPGLLPSLSTICPVGTEPFFERLLDIKTRLYHKQFQFQFSIHTTDLKYREWLLPSKKWSFEQMAAYGERFFQPGDRKITLNFALAEGVPVDPQVLLDYFSPSKYLIKITPVNPTCAAVKNDIKSYVDTGRDNIEVIAALEAAGYEVLLSVGELEENQIGSNCGQYINRYLQSEQNESEQRDGPCGYTYSLEMLDR
ncbi:radical SAM protein [Oligoflexia bacterium]|nr:radical SAM protein [Oligoflexia bacterium]